MSQSPPHESDRLMTIGDFARASGLSAKALRLYDDSGLLVPAEVDPFSGYRRYATAQLDRARLVARLRLAGMPLARIRVVADLPARAAAAELTSYWRQVEADTASAGRLLADLVSSLHTKEHDMASITTNTGLTDPQAASREGIGGRDDQLDAVYAGRRVFAVADGFGDGEGIAADVVAQIGTVDTDLDPAADHLAALEGAVVDAVSLVATRYADRPGAGCTLTAVVVGADALTLAHIGDSRAYLVREGRLERLTRDHSVVQTLIDEGRLTPEEAATDDRRVQLNRAIAVDTAYLPDIAVHGIRPGDRLVLTTDGVHRVLDAARLTELVTAPDSADQIAAEVEVAVMDAGADDNYSVLVIDL